MGMKERREARLQNLFSQFVSVKGLINYFANEERLDISEVAAELEGIIKRSGDSELPEFGSIDHAGLVFIPWSGDPDYLMDWLSDTIMGCGHADESDFHGWMRDDLFPFLRSHEFDVKENFPLWAPSSEVSQKDIQSKGAVDDGSENTHNEPGDCPLTIKGDMFSSFMRVIRAFPERFPDHKNGLPMAKEVEDWIKDAGIVKTSRPAQVFTTMVLEHFSTDS